MDPLTHAVLGAACGIAGTRLKAPRRAAALAGLAGGLLPDADIFLRSPTDDLFNIEYHRHFTHSLIFMPVIALLGAYLAAGLIRLFKRQIDWKMLLFPALLGGLSHIFCDSWTSYGTRLWWPFAQTRVSLDWISVIDPLFTVPLVACIALAVRYASRRAATVGLTWAVIYLEFCLVQRHRASGLMDQWLAGSGLQNITRRELKPSFGNVIVWRGLVQAGSEVHVVAMRCPMSGNSELMPGASAPVFASPEQAAVALGIESGSVQENDIRRFFHFSDGWVGRHPSQLYVLSDLRYASLPTDINPLWGIRLDPANPSVHVKWETFRGDATPSLSRLMKMMKGKPEPSRPAP